MPIRFGTDDNSTASAELWAATSSGLVHLVETYEEARTVTFTLRGRERSDTWGVLWGVREDELADFLAAHDRHLVLNTYRDGVDQDEVLMRLFTD